MAKTDSLFPILNASPDAKLPGPLARTAAAAPLDSSGFLTEYRPLKSRSLLSKVNSKRGVPFTHAINPYRGCEFGCRYCYARYTHEFLEMRDPEEFERKIFFKQNAAWLLTQELKRLKPGTHIAIGTATDPYQPLERKQLLTRSILEVLAQTSGFTLGIVTKSTLVARDIDVLQEVKKRNRITIHLTVTTMNTKLARILEPRAPRPDLRIQTLAKLREAGLRAGILCSPLMPGITDSRSSMAAVAKAGAAAGACFFASGPLFLKPCSLPTFFAFVKKNFPELSKAYEKRYEKSAFVSPEYRKRAQELVDSVCKEFKIGRRYGEIWEEELMPIPPAVATQQRLPFESISGS
jgi:DNA repair photolyase